MEFAFATVPTLAEHIKAGKLRAIAVTTAERVAQLPDVPTFAELGYPGVDLTPLFGLIAPAGVPSDIIEKLSSAIAESVRRPARLPQAHFYIDLENVTDIRIHKAIHYIEQRIDDLPAVTEVADHVGVSARQLERLFKKSLNMSPAALQRMLRLQYGKWRLSNTRDSITSIALGCGFSDNSHFSREFKALFGMSPRVFRQTHMGEEGGVQKTAWKVPFPNHA